MIFVVVDGQTYHVFAIFARKFFRGQPCVRMTTYTDHEHAAGGTPLRTHGWAFGLAALFVAGNKALADVHDTPQRAAFRSGLALSLSKWGCVGDPNWWDWSHLTEALEKSLRLSNCRYVGDAFMLACAISVFGKTLLPIPRCLASCVRNGLGDGSWPGFCHAAIYFAAVRSTSSRLKRLCCLSRQVTTGVVASALLRALH